VECSITSAGENMSARRLCGYQVWLSIAINICHSKGVRVGRKVGPSAKRRVTVAKEDLYGTPVINVIQNCHDISFPIGVDICDFWLAQSTSNCTPILKVSLSVANEGNERTAP